MNIKQNAPVREKEQYCRPVVNWVAPREQMCICASVAQLDDYDDADIWDL